MRNRVLNKPQLLHRVIIRPDMKMPTLQGWRFFLVLGGVFLLFAVLAQQSYRSVDAELTEAALAGRSAVVSLDG